MTRRAGLVTLILGAAATAAASPESDALFRDGRDLLKAGKVAEACEAFAGSHKLAAKVGTLLNLADCREKQGRTATAWSLFVEAKQLAAAQHDAREAEADRRAAALQARLSYLTITVARDREVAGLAIRRNGVAVDRAQWNTAIAVDPGDHVVEASAPGFKPWSTTQAVGVKQQGSVAVELLVAEPVVAPPVAQLTRAAVVAPPRLPSPPVRPLAIGLAVGGSSDQDPLIGVRISGGIAVPHGALRAIGSVLYTSFADNPDNNPDLNTQLFALGLGVDYVWMPVPGLGFAGGVGAGIDVAVQNADRPTSTAGWGTLRASPVIVRVLDGRLEIGLHVQYVQTSDRGVLLGLAAIDLFPL